MNWHPAHAEPRPTLSLYLSLSQLRMSPYLGKDGHMIATRGNFLRFGKRSPEIPDEGGDDGDVNEVFDGPVRRDYREFVR